MVGFIGPHRITVEMHKNLKASDGEEVDGLYVRNKNDFKILLSGAQHSNEAVCTTLVHEVWHAIAAELGIPDEEIYANSISTLFVQFFASLNLIDCAEWATKLGYGIQTQQKEPRKPKRRKARPRRIRKTTHKA